MTPECQKLAASLRGFDRGYNHCCVRRHHPVRPGHTETRNGATNRNRVLIKQKPDTGMGMLLLLLLLLLSVLAYPKTHIRTRSERHTASTHSTEEIYTIYTGRNFPEGRQSSQSGELQYKLTTNVRRVRWGVSGIWSVHTPGRPRCPPELPLVPDERAMSGNAPVHGHTEGSGACEVSISKIRSILHDAGRTGLLEESCREEGIMPPARGATVR
uniref:Uncharacterized protein n=1 Tax=Anopheles farauti TaxID=69004 RepID=A0A182QZD3_9DIPT